MFICLFSPDEVTPVNNDLTICMQPCQFSRTLKMSFHEEFSNDRSKLFKTEISDYLMSNATKVNLPKYVYLVACTPGSTLCEI